MRQVLCHLQSGVCEVRPLAQSFLRRGRDGGAGAAEGWRAGAVPLPAMALPRVTRVSLAARGRAEAVYRPGPRRTSRVPFRLGGSSGRSGEKERLALLRLSWMEGSDMARARHAGVTTAHSILCHWR